jgi:hypothetical protein
MENTPESVNRSSGGRGAFSFTALSSFNTGGGGIFFALLFSVHIRAALRGDTRFRTNLITSWRRGEYRSGGVVRGSKTDDSGGAGINY